MLRVRVEIVPWGQEHLAQEFFVICVGNDGEGNTYTGRYEVRAGKTWDESTKIGRFRLHRYGWYRNRLGLAARALRMAQHAMDFGKPGLLEVEPFQNSEPHRRTTKGSRRSPKSS